MSAKYVVIEGADGVGKSTISIKLQKWVESRGINAIHTRHPGSTPFGQEIRRLTKEYKVDPITEALLFAVDNSAFTYQILQPTLAKGIWVIADRNNFISSMAYQIASGCPITDLDQVHDAIPNPPKIDLLIILRADVRTIRNRVAARGGEKNDRFEALMNTDNSYFNKVIKAYDTMLEEPNAGFQHRLSKFVRLTTTVPKAVPRCIGIDANCDEDQVFESVKQAVETIM